MMAVQQAVWMEEEEGIMKASTMKIIWQRAKRSMLVVSFELNRRTGILRSQPFAYRTVVHSISGGKTNSLSRPRREEMVRNGGDVIERATGECGWTRTHVPVAVDCNFLLHTSAGPFTCWE